MQMQMQMGTSAELLLLVWPWLVENPSAGTYIAGAVYAAALIGIVSIFRERIWRGIQQARELWRSDAMVEKFRAASKGEYLFWIALSLSIVTAGWLSLLIYHHQSMYILNIWFIFMISQLN